MFTSQSEFWSRAARRLGWALTLALVLLMLQSAFWSERVPLALKLGVGVLAVLAAFRPGDALVVVVGFAPLGHLLTTRIWNAYPFALSEALVLAFFAGYLWHERGSFKKTAVADGMVLSSGLFALVIFASCLVQLAELQVRHDYPLSYARSFLEFLTKQYLTSIPDPRPWVDGRAFVSTAALLLEGVGLLLSARTLCAQQHPLARRLTNVIVTAGTAVAVLYFYDLTATGVITDHAIASTIGIRRGSPAIPSINTSGTYFMLVAFVAMGTAAASRAYLLPWFLVGAMSIGAMWLTQTRTAIVAGLAALGATAVWLVTAQGLRLRPSRAVVIAGVVAVAAGVALVVYQPLHVFSGGAGRWPASTSLHFRFLLSETAWRMLIGQPLFGVGVGQYALRYPEFASPELLAVHSRIDAHNNFLQVGAELGFLALALFLWLVGAALVSAWSQLRRRPSDYWLLGAVAGLVAFIITWLVGQPLSVPQVAYTFWILLGVVTARSLAGAVTTPHRYPMFARLALAATVVVIVSSVPVRARRAISEIDLSRVSYGFYNSSRADNRDFRWAGPRVRFYRRSSVKAINIPLAAKLPDTPNGADVDIFVNGRIAHHIELRDKEWHDIRVNAPASAERFWRVDLNITPIDVPAGLEDARRRICVGEISLERRQEGL